MHRTPIFDSFEPVSPLALNESQGHDMFNNDQGDLSDFEVCHKLCISMNAMTSIRQQVSKTSWAMYCTVTIEKIPARKVAEKFGVKSRLVHLNNCQIQKMICQSWDLDATTELDDSG